MLRSYIPVLRNRPYMLLWSGALVSSFGDKLTEFGLAWYVLGRTGNPLDVGFTLLIFQLPSLFTGVIAGWLLDRFRREAVMLVDNLVRGGLVVLIPILDGLNLLSLPMLFLLVGLLGAFSVITSVGSRTLITEFVPEAHYNAANSLDVMQSMVSGLAGPGLAGLLVYLIGPLSLLWLDGFTFFFLSATLLLMLRMPRAGVMPEWRKVDSPKVFLAQLVEGIGYCFKSPLMLVMLSVSFLWNFGLGVYQVALPFYCENVLGVGPAGMGAMLTVNALGAFLAAFIFGPIRPRFPGRITCSLLVADAVCYLLLGFIPIFWLGLVVSFFLGVFDDIGAIYLTTIRQRTVPQHLMGRVFSFYGTVGPGGMPLGSGLGGLLIAGLGSTVVVSLAGLPLALVGLTWLKFGPLRQVSDEKI